jgi:transcriptional regulator with XRE-family HTH domain
MTEHSLEQQLEQQRQAQVNRYTHKVAELLKYARKKSGLSARELARRVGSSHSTILAYEAGKKVPVTTTLMRLIHACGFSLDFELAPRIRGDADYPRGSELADVLELASAFPAKHGDKPDAYFKL